MSAQCKMLGVARSTYYAALGRPKAPKAPDPLEPDVLAAHGESRGRYGARETKALLARSGKVASRRRICRIMRENGLTGAYGRKRFKAHPGKPNEADLPNIPNRELDGHGPRTHVVSDLACVRVGGVVELRVPAGGPLQPRDRRPLGGRPQGRRPGQGGVRHGRLPDIRHRGVPRRQGSEFDNAQAGELLDAFGIERPLSRRGCRYDNAVDESTNKILKAEPACRESFSDTRDLQAKLSDYVHWHDHSRLHSTLGRMSPVEFREAGLSL